MPRAVAWIWIVLYLVSCAVNASEVLGAIEHLSGAAIAIVLIHWALAATVVVKTYLDLSDPHKQ